MQQGTINVQSQNIFPIIKKFLYSDQDIFLRELVSNATDATNKLKTIAQHEAIKGTIDDLQITIKIDKEAKTLHIIDQGIGMNADEVDKYINQIAFSGATEFMEKYKDASIIGHFGLGFYSAFMVADIVEVVSKSYRSEDKAVRWVCEGKPEFEMKEDEKTERGTEIILHIGEAYTEYLEPHKIQSLLEKHAKFNSVKIYFEDKCINETDALWLRKPSELTDEDYIKFYEYLHPFQAKPEFWIHLNVDYPFTLNGILYFPKFDAHRIENNRNKIALYCNRVFVTEEVKDIVPEYLQLLHGIIDSPDIPLNVSRSYLQSDANVKKITSHISKKVADKLEELYKNNADSYIQKWESIGLFVKYGMITDEKFYERAKQWCIVHDTDGNAYTLDQYRENVKDTQSHNEEVVYLYTNDTEAHYSLIQKAKERGYTILKLNDTIDPHFIQSIEYKIEKTQFKRIDADTLDKLIDKDAKQESVLSQTQQDDVKKIVEDSLNEHGKAMVSIEALNPNEVPLQIVKPEFIRRMEEMNQFRGMMPNDFGNTHNVVINSNHSSIQQLLDANEETRKERITKMYHLALLQNGLLKGEALHQFINEAYQAL